MPRYDSEWSALIKEILGRPEFRRAPVRAKLLRYLFANIHKSEPISRKTLAVDVFGSKLTDDSALAAVGERCQDLRKELSRFAESGAGLVQKWRCELPSASPSEGYRLGFVNRIAAPGATGAFWQAHLTPLRDVLVVYNEPLFYRDEAEFAVVRYLDINPDQAQTNPEFAVRELRAKRPRVRKGKLHPSYLYLVSGEVAARDGILHWFDTVAGIRAEGAIGRRITSHNIRQSSPVLLGNLRTNSFIRDIVADYGKHLDYRLDPEVFGTIAIRNPSKHERKALQKQGDGRESGSETQDGGLLLKSVRAPNRDVFGVVTRLPHPYDNEGAVTIISSDHSRAVEQIAQMLTTEERFSAAIVQAGWSKDEPLPACFQYLFAVRLGPVKLDTEAKPAVLLAARAYQT